MHIYDENNLVKLESDFSASPFPSESLRSVLFQTLLACVIKSIGDTDFLQSMLFSSRGVLPSSKVQCTGIGIDEYVMVATLSLQL